jgi:RNA polymerase sigma-70 factor (ECF subfamily)
MAPSRGQQHAILNALSRAKPDRARGGPDFPAALSQKESPAGPDSDLLRLEYRREVFRWAARQVRKEFRQETWDAFWQTAVEGRSVDVVAKELAKDAGAIYTARSRVMQRIREKVRQYEEET